MSGYECLFSEVSQLRNERDQAVRERDEAREQEKWVRVVNDELAAESIQRKERLEQAVALLRTARPYLANGGMFTSGPEEVVDCARIDAFLAGQPAPVKAEVDDAVVERACAAMWSGMWPHDCVNPDDQRNDMRAALVAALEGRT